MSRYGPNDIPVKTEIGTAQKNSASAQIPPHLYQLLVLINGVRTVDALLRMGIRGIDVDSFDTLYQLKLIEAPKGSAVQESSLANSLASNTKIGNKKGLSELRFAVLDILLDLSEKDFGARPWIEKIEKVDSIARLSAEVEACCDSPFGRNHPEAHILLRRALIG